MNDRDNNCGIFSRTMTTRIRRKKSSLSEVKIAVVGAPGVGKSGWCSGQYSSTRDVEIPISNKIVLIAFTKIIIE